MSSAPPPMLSEWEVEFATHFYVFVFQVIYLKGRGIKELQRNILVENILEKFKEEREILQTKEQNELAQMCEKHGEIMNLVFIYTMCFILAS